MERNQISAPEQKSRAPLEGLEPLRSALTESRAARVLEAKHLSREPCLPGASLHPCPGRGPGPWAVAASPGRVPRLLTQTRVYKVLCASCQLTTPCKPLGPREEVLCWGWVLRPGKHLVLPVRFSRGMEHVHWGRGAGTLTGATEAGMPSERWRQNLHLGHASSGSSRPFPCTLTRSWKQH